MKALDFMRLAGLSLALAGTALTGCDGGSSDADAADAAHEHDHDHSDHEHGDHDAGESTPTDESSTDNGDSAGDGDGDNSMETFGARMSEALADGDTAAVLANVKAVGLPEGWQGMLTPMLASMGGQDLASQVKPVSEFSREDLQWPDGDLPDALAEVEHILEVEWSETAENGDSESGRFTFPLIQEDGEWRLLLVGPGA